MIRIVEVDNRLYKELYEFFEKIKDNRFFYPHPFTREEANARCRYSGEDIYAVVAEADICGYGMVRGIGVWETPTVGICVSEECQRKGIGELLLGFLHVSARLRGIKKLRLHVDSKNTKAIALYKKLGYEFVGVRENGELIGYKGL